ncbi:MAG: formylglycine-generating enzyme family protein, partial [Bacteroidota bacterium]
RLPTEAEWEYAARGGNKSNGYEYSGSNNLNEVGLYWDNFGSKTHAVGEMNPNELGLYDMSGNVWEWCSDWKGDYPSGSQINPTGPTNGSSRVIRGGSWNDYPRNCRVAVRHYGAPGHRSGYLGFRLARTK